MNTFTNKQLGNAMIVFAIVIFIGGMGRLTYKSYKRTQFEIKYNSNEWDKYSKYDKDSITISYEYINRILKGQELDNLSGVETLFMPTYFFDKNYPLFSTNFVTYPPQFIWNYYSDSDYGFLNLSQNDSTDEPEIHVLIFREELDYFFTEKIKLDHSKLQTEEIAFTYYPFKAIFKTINETKKFLTLKEWNEGLEKLKNKNY